jgi:hypothetical protein
MSDGYKYVKLASNRTQGPDCPKREMATDIQLDPWHGPSIMCWATHLQEEHALLAFKASCDPPHACSFLAANTFILIIQTEYQKEIFRKLGNSFMSIDVTHNTTHYENVNLYLP